MITLDTAAQTRLEASSIGLAWLIEMDLTGGLVRYTTWGASLTATVDGQVREFTGLGDALSVSAVTETEDAAADQVTLGLSLANTAMLSAALGSVHTYRGRPVRLYLQPLDDAGIIDGAAVRRFSGQMDKVKVGVEEDDTGARTGRVELVCSRIGVARARHDSGLRLSHVQQQKRFPGDRGLEMLTSLIETPRTWLSKRFQAI